MGTGYYGGFGETNGAQDHAISQEQALFAELEKSGVKFTREDVVFITEDSTGQIVWLEKGSPSAGLEHILNGDGQKPGHSSDFQRAFGISESEIPSYLKNVISNGKVVSDVLKPIGKRMGYERVYYYNGEYHVVTGIGTNGFIVSAYPKRMKNGG